MPYISQQAYAKDLGGWLQIQAANAQLLFGGATEASLAPLVTADAEAEPGSFQSLVNALPGWQRFMALYAYACDGVASEIAPLRSEFFDQFFDSPLSLLRLPKTVLDVVNLAQARQVLDGGAREFMEPSDEGSVVPPGHLTVSEIAALAGIDTRSVRNAMNPKLADPLVGQSFGNRVFVQLEEARRWLAGRKGFKPTAHGPEPSGQSASVVITGGLAARLQRDAARVGLTIEALVERALSEERLP